MKMCYSARKEKGLPPERKSSHLARSTNLLLRCVFVVLLGVMALGAVNILHALPVCDRTPQVRDAIVEASPGVNNCHDVTEAHLAAITGLLVYEKSIKSLKAGDFEGLTSFTSLNLFSNRLTSLPEGDIQRTYFAQETLSG